jgi:nucleoid DNA-binding protein
LKEEKFNFVKMKKLLLLLSLIIFACQSPTKISEKEVMVSFNSFFEVLDNDLDNFESMVTEDFFIFENSRRYSKEEFIEFVKTFDIVSSKRTFEDVVIDTDINSAHISLKHFGEFIVNTPTGKTKLEFEWLESTYAVKIDNKLKFKFYFSEAIKTNTTNLESETTE